MDALQAPARTDAAYADARAQAGPDAAAGAPAPGPARDRGAAPAAAFWQRLLAAPHEHDLFHALRWVDARMAGRCALGRAPLPQDEPVRLRQEPSMAFAPSQLAGARAAAGGRPAEIAIHGFGLFGPNGPLPLHLTEFVRERRQHHGDATLAAFADIFHHRLILLFYRAWADAQATVDLDLGQARFTRYVASLVNLAAPSQRRRDSIADHAKYYMAPHLVRQTRNADGLRQILQTCLGVPVAIREFVVQWLRLDAPLALGSAAGRSAGQPMAGGLGRDSVLGLAVRDAQHRFRIEIGPLDRDTYAAFLPGRPLARRLLDWVRNYTGVELDWDVRLVLAGSQVQGVRLGAPPAAPLGLGCWLGRRSPQAGDARDLLIDMEARMRAHARAGRPPGAARPAPA